MTPTAQDLLNAANTALATPTRPEDAGVFAAARARLVALTNHLVELENEDAITVRMRENAALRDVIGEAGPAHGIAARDAHDIGDGDYSLAALDAANAGLRRLLIRLHEAVERSHDVALDRRLLKLYRDMARWRELDLPPVKPVP
jgi:hypothetical protein